MKTLLYVVLATGLAFVEVPSCLAQTDGSLPTTITVAPSGIPPKAATEISRVAGAYLKADKPANDAVVHAIVLRDAGDLAGADAECVRALSLSVKEGSHTFHPEAYQLLGELALRQNRIDDALREFKLWTAERDSRKGILSLSPFGHRSSDACVALDMALAYCQRGNLQLALRYFNDPAMPKFPPPYLSMFSSEEGPGTRTLAALQATVLLQIAYNVQSDTRTDSESDRCLLAAAQLAPKNAMAAFACARMLRERGKYVEQLPYLQVVADNGKGQVAEEAKRSVDWVRYVRDHPKEFQKPKTEH